MSRQKQNNENKTENGQGPFERLGEIHLPSWGKHKPLLSLAATLLYEDN
jgi:hypothetical protein